MRRLATTFRCRVSISDANETVTRSGSGIVFDDRPDFAWIGRYPLPIASIDAAAVDDMVTALLTDAAGLSSGVAFGRQSAC